MNLNYFKEFVVLAETKNYWEASERLFMNQSTLSKHIQAMENHLGVPLFKRTTRTVELTEFGILLLPYAKSIIQIQFEYSTLLMQKKNYDQNLLAIGSLPAMTQYNITNILLNFGKTYPESTPKIIEDDTNILKQLLVQKKCELAFLRETKSIIDNNFFNEETLAHIPYLSDYMVAVLPRCHPLSHRPNLSLRELQNEKLCFIKENTTLYDLCRYKCQEADFIPNIVYDSHRLDNILDMVAYGGYVALLMNKHVERQTQTSPGCAADPPFSAVKISPAITTQISLCYLKNSPLTTAAKQFIGYFKKNYRAGNELPNPTCFNDI